MNLLMSSVFCKSAEQVFSPLLSVHHAGFDGIILVVVLVGERRSPVHRHLDKIAELTVLPPP